MMLRQLVVTLVCALLLVATNVVLSEEEGKANIDLMSVIQKLPAIVPFLVAKVETQSCKSDLTKFKEEVDRVSGPRGGVGKSTIPELKAALCKVPMSCTGEVITTLKKMIASGGFMEKIAKSFLDGKGIDLETADLLILAYIENMCSENGSGEQGAADLDEL